jgi:hypothetical protein
VEHVRVGHDDLAGRPDRRADRCRCVAVVRRRDDRQVGGRRELTELGDLVLPERFRREQEERPRRGILGDRLEGGQRVAEGLAGCGRRDDDDILPGMDRLDGLRLQPGMSANDGSRAGMTS